MNAPRHDPRDAIRRLWPLRHEPWTAEVVRDLLRHYLYKARQHG